MRWLSIYRDSKLFPRVIESRQRGYVFEYDMEYLPDTVTFADFFACGQSTFLRAEILSRIFAKTTHFHRPLDWGKRERRARLEALIQEKLVDNLYRCTKEFPAFATWSDEAQVCFNGWQGPNWQQAVRSFLDNEPLLERMAEEETVAIHGDLTFSNILINAREEFFFIDPNPDNIFSTASMELAKMMQSIHVGYERLEGMHTVTVAPTGSVTYTVPPFTGLNELANDFWILKRVFFPQIEERVLYAHLAIHMARIVPYRLRRLDPKCWIYLGEMLKYLKKALE
jgi:hypothetical protein